MHIREYLFVKNMSVKALAELAEVCPDYLSQIKNMKKIPSKKLAKRIERVTDGKVTAKELLNEKKEL